MKIKECLLSELVKCHSSARSAKGVLNCIATLTADHIPGADGITILEALLARERLGSTALSHGVALPHAVCSGLDQPIACLIHLEKPIDFGAPDSAPVDIFFALILPERSQDHLPLLAEIASKLREQTYRDGLRAAQDDRALYDAALMV